MTELNLPAIANDVHELLAKDTSGHGMQHVERVEGLAVSFAKKEGADIGTVALIALLHDVDDYKLFGKESADNLTNANKILDTYDVDKVRKGLALDAIRSMGYNKYLEGVRPATLEGQIVSDADMCDAIGSIGILRTHAYALSKGNEFFDKTQAPIDRSLSADQYRSAKHEHSVQHFFDKLLTIPSILLTESGREEGEKRKNIMTTFLSELFEEEGSHEWQDYLRKYEN